MYASCGTKKCGGMKVAIYSSGSAEICPPQPNKIRNDRFPRCHGCPYPRHGQFCWSEDGFCLRTEMAEIERRSRNRRQLEAMPI